MRLFAIDSSSAMLRLAVSDGPDRSVKREDRVERSHGQQLLKSISELLSSFSIEPAKLDGLVVVTGPGSFTGIRIGLAAAKGMARALSCPLVGVSLFDIALASYPSADLSGIVVPFAKDQFSLIRLDAPATAEVIFASALSGLLASGNWIGLSPDHTIPWPVIPSAGVFGYDGAALLAIGESKLALQPAGDDITSLEPLYLQPSTAERNLSAVRRS